MIIVCQIVSLIVFLIPYHVKIKNCFISIRIEVNYFREKVGFTLDNDIEIIRLISCIIIKIFSTLAPCIIVYAFSTLGSTNVFAFIFAVIGSFIMGLWANGQNYFGIDLWADYEEIDNLRINDELIANENIFTEYEENFNESDEITTEKADFFHINWSLVNKFMDAKGKGLKLTRDNGVASIAAIHYKSKTILLNEEILLFEHFSTEDVIALIGHEIIHYKLRIKDRFIFFFSQQLPMLVAVALILLLYVPMPNSMGIIGELFQILLFFMSLFMLSIWFVIFLISRRLEPQITELKCDRLACELLGIAENNMYNALKKLKELDENFEIMNIEGKETDKESLSKESLRKNIMRTLNNFDEIEKKLEKFKDRYINFHEHPNLDYRIKIIENYKNWNYFEYYKHAYIVTKWIIIGKGWVGE